MPDNKMISFIDVILHVYYNYFWITPAEIFNWILMLKCQANDYILIELRGHHLSLSHSH